MEAWRYFLTLLAVLHTKAYSERVRAGLIFVCLPSMSVGTSWFPSEYLKRILYQNGIAFSTGTWLGLPRDVVGSEPTCFFAIQWVFSLSLFQYATAVSSLGRSIFYTSTIGFVHLFFRRIVTSHICLEAMHDANFARTVLFGAGVVP